MRKIAAAAAMAFIAASVSAGTLVVRDDGVRVSIEGASFRMDMPPATPIVCDSIVSRDGKNAACLNSELHTWFENANPGAMSPRRLAVNGAKLNLDSPKIDAHDETSGETIAGHPTEKHVILAKYTLIDSRSGTDVRIFITATAILWTAPDLPALPFRGGIVSGYAEIDERFAAIFQTFNGMVVKQTLAVTAMYERGRPFTDTLSWSATSIEPKTFGATTFDVPANYRHEFPQVVAPAR